MMIKTGDSYRVWWSTSNGNMARVLSVDTYTGRYKDMFTHVLRLEASGTKRGWLDMAVKMEVNSD